MLMCKNKNDINNKNLFKAIKNTFNKRNTEFNTDKFKEIVEILKESNALRRVFADYQDKLEYTKQVNFNDTIESINEIIDILVRELVEVEKIRLCKIKY